MRTRPLLKRIALNGGLTAVLLAGIGLAFAEVAGVWLAAGPGTRGPAPGAADPLRDDLRFRVPLTMAVWGFVFVAAGEVGLFLWRGGPPAPKPAEAKPDPAEWLLEELLAKAEATYQGSGDRDQQPQEAERGATESARPGGSNTTGSVS